MRRMHFMRTGLFAALTGLVMLLSACGSAVLAPAYSANNDVRQSEEFPAQPPGETVATRAAGYESVQEDGDGAWEQNSSTAITFNGADARITGTSAAFSGGTLSIKKAGTYVLSGTLDNGQIRIDAGKNDTVRLVLNGVSLHNEEGPAIYAPKSNKVILVLEKDTQNTVSDALYYAASGDDNEPDAAIFVQDDLHITGEGRLTVAGNYKHGIRAQDMLAIYGGVIEINAAGDALRGRDGVYIQEGRFSLKAGGDGIQSNNADSGDLGFVTIAGGTFIIEAGSDGIQAESTLTVTGGSFQIQTGGGSANAPVRRQESRGGWGGRDRLPQAANEDTVSRKALKAGKLVEIRGGDFTIDAVDDAIHSNDGIVVVSGKFTIKTGDDGIHADAAVEISGGEILITTCYEGIEGLSVSVSGGEITVAANDDAINAAGGTDSESVMGRPMDGGRFSINENIFVRISGGSLDLYAAHDGIDANGNVFLEGGSVKISGPSQGMEGAIDFDGSMTVKGGELITAGSVISASENSTQPVILVSYSSQKASGSVITLKDAQGKTLLEYTSKTAFSMSGFSSPSFQIGETYSLYLDGEKRGDITLHDMITGVGDDGGAYRGVRGFGGGGRAAPPAGDAGRSSGNRIEQASF